MNTKNSIFSHKLYVITFALLLSISGMINADFIKKTIRKLTKTDDLTAKNDPIFNIKNIPFSIFNSLLSASKGTNLHQNIIFKEITNKQLNPSEALKPFLASNEYQSTALKLFKAKEKNIQARIENFEQYKAPQHVQDFAWQLYKSVEKKDWHYDQEKIFLKEQFLTVYQPPSIETKAAAYTINRIGGICFPSNSFYGNKKLTPMQIFNLAHEVGHNYYQHTYNPNKIRKRELYHDKHEMQAQKFAVKSCYALKQYEAIEVGLCCKKNSPRNCPYRQGVENAFKKLLKKYPQDKKLQVINNKYNEKLTIYTIFNNLFKKWKI